MSEKTNDPRAQTRQDTIREHLHEPPSEWGWRAVRNAVIAEPDWTTLDVLAEYVTHHLQRRPGWGRYLDRWDALCWALGCLRWERMDLIHAALWGGVSRVGLMALDGDVRGMRPWFGPVPVVPIESSPGVDDPSMGLLMEAMGWRLEWSDGSGGLGHAVEREAMTLAPHAPTVTYTLDSNTRDDA